jgi:EpsI family protein
MNRLKISKKGIALTCILIVTSAAAILLTPKFAPPKETPSLEERLPRRVDDWRAISTSTIQVGLSTDSSIDQPYNQTVMRSYVNSKGKVINLAVAWGEKQRQEVKIHRPELCYPAQGLQVISLADTAFPISQPQNVTGKRMVAKNNRGQLEAVSYWIRVGLIYSDSAWQTRKHILKEGLSGHIPDGVLVRVSQQVTQDDELESAFESQEEFASRLVALTDEPTRAMLVR